MDRAEHPMAADHHLRRAVLRGRAALLLFVDLHDGRAGRSTRRGRRSPFRLDRHCPTTSCRTSDGSGRGPARRGRRARAARCSAGLLLALAGVGILAIIIGYFVADRALKPIQQMTATARKLSGTTLAHRADRPQGTRRRAQGAGRHLRRHADQAQCGIRHTAKVRGQRLARAAHPVDDQPDGPGDRPGRSRRRRGDLKALGRTLLEVNARNEQPHRGAAAAGPQRARAQRCASRWTSRTWRETAIDQLASARRRTGSR